MPRALLGRDGVEALDRGDAVRGATRPNRAGGYSYMYAFRGRDALTLQVTATRHGLVETAVHTNHALDATVAEAAEPPSPGSLSRFDRTCADPPLMGQGRHADPRRPRRGWRPASHAARSSTSSRWPSC